MMRSPLRRRIGEQSAKSDVANSATPDFGPVGEPIDRAHPFAFGFLAAMGALTAIALMRALASASQVFILVIISLFFAAGLNPVIKFLMRRGLKRGQAVGAIVALVLAAVAIFAWLIIPPVINQATTFLKNAPTLIEDLKHTHWINSLNQHYGIVDALNKKVSSSIHNGQFVVSAFGGLFGVGKAVFSGAIAALSVLVLTLYFTASLPSVTSVVYRFIQASRRERVAKITDAIIERIGAFVGSQVTVGVIAGIFALTLSLILGVPYPTAVGLFVLICGIIPLIGHFLGIAVFTLIALTKSPITAAIVFIAYLIYVQIENYFIMPRIMRKSLAMPGIVTILAALTGTSLLGLIGGLLSVPIAAALMLIIEEVWLPKQELN
jgi:predicted PurR-regulated permease PerM